MYATPPATSTMLPLRCVAHRYASFIHIFRSSPLLFPTDGLKNSNNKYHVHRQDGHGIFSFHLFTSIIQFRVIGQNELVLIAMSLVKY